MKDSNRTPGNKTDRKARHKAKAAIETIMVIAAILLIPLFFAIRTAANPPAAANAPSSSTTSTKEPPACGFPLAQTITSEPVPENYTFSEPTIVSEPAPNDSEVQIVGWLPDDQRVLVVQNAKGSLQQTIGLINAETGERLVYATREQTEQPPAWDENLGAVVYPVRHLAKRVNNVPQYNRQAWISYGDPQFAKMIADNLVASYVAVKPDSEQIAYFSDKQINRWDGLLKKNSPVAFDLDQWNYRNLKSGIAPLMYELAWRPGTSQVFLYSFADVKPGYTFLLDTDTGKICQLDFGGWAVTARWSPDGRYLAIERSQAPGRPVGPTVLTVLDTATGDLYTSEVVPQEMVGMRGVQDLAWAPDNRHLLVIGTVRSLPQCAPNCQRDTRLYLVDVISSQVEPILSEHQFVAYLDGNNLAWSPDGSTVIALCPALCSISVQRNGR